MDTALRVLAAVVALIAGQVIAMGVFVAVTAGGTSGLLTAAVLVTVGFGVGLPAVGLALDNRTRITAAGPRSASRG